MKKTYTKLSISPVAVEMDSTILTGSVTTMKIKVQNVTVDEYDNGFATETNGFKEIGFD